jgi:hypothetical protein
MTPEEGAASGRFSQLQQVTVQIFTPSTINPGAYASGLIRDIATKVTFVRRTPSSAKRQSITPALAYSDPRSI